MFDLEKLQLRCTMQEDKFAKLETAPEMRDRSLVHIDRNSNILGVAHMDSVNSHNLFVVGRNKAESPVMVWSPKLDNRLGVYILVDLLPELGINTDVLLTTDEEILESTGMWFTPEKNYNWMFSFDRAGFDAVMYQYAIPSLEEAVERCGVTVGDGQYSCLMDMGHVGCRGINFGNGIYGPHGPLPMIHLPSTATMINRFIKFYKENEHVRWPYTQTPQDLGDLADTKMLLAGDDGLDDSLEEWLELLHESDDAGDDIEWCDYCSQSEPAENIIWIDELSAGVCQRCAGELWPYARKW